MIQHRPTGIRRWLKGFMLRRVHGMITCEQFEAFVLAYLDDDLPPARRVVFDRHLRWCRECREYLAAYRRSIELGREVSGAGGELLGEDVPEDLIRAILDANRH